MLRHCAEVAKEFPVLQPQIVFFCYVIASWKISPQKAINVDEAWGIGQKSPEDPLLSGGVLAQDYLWCCVYLFSELKSA